MKTCFKCNRKKPLDEFYKHPRMADGHLNKCKQCAKKDVKTNYEQNREHYSAYDQLRNRTERRRKLRLVYQARSRQRNPHKYKARQAVSNALRDGKIQRQPCEKCGNEKSQAHHTDYYKPLDVQWMCFKCHREIGHGQTVVSQ